MKAFLTSEFDSIATATDGRTYFQEWQHRTYKRLTVCMHGLVGTLPAFTIHIKDYVTDPPIESLEEALDICRQGLKFHYHLPRRRVK